MDAVYATIPLLCGDGAGGLKTFEPGDEIQGHYTPEALAWLIGHDQASIERPAGFAAAYSLVDGLGYHHHYFKRGDRLDGVIPAALVRQIVDRGEASFEPPDKRAKG